MSIMKRRVGRFILLFLATCSILFRWCAHYHMPVRKRVGDVKVAVHLNNILIYEEIEMNSKIPIFVPVFSFLFWLVIFLGCGLFAMNLIN